MKILGLIPARGGSERCPGKNIADLDGKPLIAWTIEAAQQSEIFDQIVTSTDSEEISNVALEYGSQVLPRPHMLATADAATIPTVLHALEETKAGVVVVMQPTSPFRSAEDIKNSYDMFTTLEADVVLSVTKTPIDAAFEVGHANRLRPVSNAVVENGALYLASANYLWWAKSWYRGVFYGYYMPEDRSLDIDTKFDLERARFMAQAQREAA